MWTHRNVYDLFLQQRRKHSLGYVLVFHYIFEDGIINGIGNVYYHEYLDLYCVFAIGDCSPATKVRNIYDLRGRRTLFLACEHQKKNCHTNLKYDRLA